MRKNPLVNGYLYHIFTKSISDYIIFRSNEDLSRMIEMMKYYIYEKPPIRFSSYHKLFNTRNINVLEQQPKKDILVDIIAYCIMPTHVHFILNQLKDNGISTYMKNLLNSYTRYFNIKYNRKGPLWQGRFKSVLIETDEQLLHLTRYIHLNPTSNNLVKKPEEWIYSSYKAFIKESDETLCNFTKYINKRPEVYKEFTESQKDYQRKLKEIRNLLLE